MTCWDTTESPQFEITCPWCRGKAEVCEQCEGHGTIQFFRCKRSYWSAECDAVVRSFGMLEKGILPVAGGWSDQSAQWVDAVAIVEREVDDYRRKAMEDARRDH